MISAENPIKSPENPSRKQPENCPRNENLFSPGFRSVAAMAGWDEEALLVASLIVEDTPDRQFKPKRRSVFRSSKTPPSNSRRKRKAQRQNSASIPVAVLDLDEDECKSKQENEKINTETNITEEVETKGVDNEVKSKGNGVSSSSPAIPCIDRLREELSCAICLEMCYEPSTTPCGHSFCKKCLRSAADRCGKINTETNITEEVEKKGVDNEVKSKGNGVSSSSPAIPCIDRLREELSCAICLEMCYEPSTTPCGHSFCKKCLRSAADRCGKKCPKCRHLISNSKYCTVNTVLWNTIQLLFPQEVEARKMADSTSESPETKVGVPTRTRSHNTRNIVVEALNSPESERNDAERRRNHHRIRNRNSRVDVTRTAVLPNQDEDAALALRLQREEFMGAERRNSVSTARANLRAMASRAINIRIRGRRD